MKKSLCKAIFMLSKYFAIGFVVQFFVFSTLLGKSVEAQLNSAIPDNLHHVTVEEVFNVLSKRAHVTFVYDNKYIDKTEEVNIKGKSLSAGEVLNKLTKKLGVSYKKIGHTITLKKVRFSKKLKALPALSEPLNLISANQVGYMGTYRASTISGTVTDSTENPLIGVTVQVKGTTKGTVTDAQGHFEIVADKDATLVFSYVGYQDKEVPVNSQETINVTMISGATGLNELVVVGYGTQKKKNLTGAVSSISSDKIENRPVPNVSNALQGTMPGVTVVSDNGQPGRDAGNINIRGIGTLNNSNPMVVVDGVVSSMDNINPNDIATITVLKDAASAAIYGSRAANGVILITTKKGKEGELTVHYNGYIGKQTPTALPDFVPSWQAAKLYNEVQKNEGRPTKYTKEDIEKYKNGSDPDNYPNTDWLDLLYQGSGIQQHHYIDVSGGSAKTQYMFSMGYFDQQGVVENTRDQRYSARLNLTTHISERLTVNGKISYTRELFKEPTNPYTGNFAQIMRQANRISRMIPYKYSNGYYGYIADGNPIAWLDLDATHNVNTHKLVGIANADFEIVKGLHIKPLLGYRLNINRTSNFVKDIQFYDHTTGNPTFYQGPNSQTMQDNFNNVITLQALLDYKKVFNEVHDFHALVGYSEEYTQYNWLQGYRKNFLNNELGQLNAGPTNGQQATGSAHEIALRSVFGRINYAYKGKYLLEGNLRYDGSSRFSSKNRWGLYPSVSGGWRISEESFFQPIKSWFSNLKLRASWGQLGNQNIVINGAAYYYPYIPTISAGQNYNFGGSVVTGIAPTAGANQDIKWETTTQTDIGLDAGFFKGKLTLSADYFIKNTDNILLNVPVSNVFGKSAPVQNAGAVKNSGLELTVGYRNNSGAVTYNVSTNASFIKNEVTDLHGTGPIINSFSFMKAGYPINSFYGYKSLGIFQSKEEVDNHATQSLGGPTAPGDLIYKDITGDGKVDGDDRTYLGNYFPKVAFGLHVGLEWKHFDLMLFLQGAADVDGFIYGEILGQPWNSAGKPTSILLDAWTADNHSTKFPRLWHSYKQNDPGSNPSSFWVRDASYVRLKNLQVGYTLPQSITKKVGVEEARIYYSGQNILTLTSFYDWVDPEAPAGERGYDYPQVLVNSIGISLTF